MSITLDILRRGPFAAGHAFGDTGAYERIDVRAALRNRPRCTRQRPGDRHLPRTARQGRAGPLLAGLLPAVSRCIRSGATERCCWSFPTAATSAACSSSTMPPAPTTLAVCATPATASMRRGYTVMVVAWQGDVLPGDGTARRGPSRGHRSRQAAHGARARGIRQRCRG